MARVSDTKFAVDYTKEATFAPGKSPAFCYYQKSWLDNLSDEPSELLDWWAANLCILSYREEEDIKKSLQGKGEFLRSFKGGTQYAFAVKVKTVIFLVIQGSANLEDSILNMKFLKRKEGGVFYHSGFLQATDLLWSEMSLFIESQKGDLVVCGHSLGGAIGQIVSSRVKLNQLITFGAPRVGTSKASERSNNPHRRYVNCCDAVPMLPPSLFGFQHTGQLIFIDDKQKLQSSLSFKARLLASLSYFYSFEWCQRRLVINRLLSDHGPINYCTALARHLIENELEKNPF